MPQTKMFKTVLNVGIEYVLFKLWWMRIRCLFLTALIIPWQSVKTRVIEILIFNKFQLSVNRHRLTVVDFFRCYLRSFKAIHASEYCVVKYLSNE